MSEFRIDQVTNRSGEAGTSVSGITTFSGTSGMILPNGPSEYRGERGRGVWYCGAVPRENVIDYITIASTGNAQDFGDASTTTNATGGGASSTRGVFIGGEDANPGYNSIHYVTFASSGGAIDFGELTHPGSDAGGYYPFVASNQTRAVTSYGYGAAAPTQNRSAQEYITIATTGNGKEWADVSAAGTRFGGGTCSSPTRGIFIGGIQSAAGIYDESQGDVVQSAGAGISYMRSLTFSTIGSSEHFGNLTYVGEYITGASNSTRGIIMGGSPSPSNGNATNNIAYITITSGGQETNFGDLTVRRWIASALASETRAVCAGGQLQSAPSWSNTMDYVTIQTTGDATDFGDLTTDRAWIGAASDVHGGLG